MIKSDTDLSYCAIFESMGNAVIALDAKGLIVLWNPAAEKLYGWAKEEVIHQHYSHFLAAVYEDPDETLEHSLSVIEQRGIWIGKLHQTHKDGSNLLVESTVCMYTLQDDNKRGFIAINRGLQTHNGENIGSETAIHSDSGLSLVLQSEKINLGYSQTELLQTLNQQAEENSALLKESRANAEQLQLLSNTLIRLQERERENLAREFHDEIGQSLTALYLNLRTIPADIITANSIIGIGISESLEITSRLMEQVRSISLDLHPKILDDLGFIPAIRWLITRTAKLAQYEVQFEPPKNFVALEKEKEFELFRMIQEAITNILRHAQAKHVFIQIDQHDSVTKVLIQDDGIGFPQPVHYSTLAQLPLTAFGLHSMFARAQLINATLQIESSPHTGTCLTIHCSQDYSSD